jgi:hypothetical protein
VFSALEYANICVLTMRAVAYSEGRHFRKVPLVVLKTGPISPESASGITISGGAFMGFFCGHNPGEPQARGVKVANSGLAGPVSGWKPIFNGMRGGLMTARKTVRTQQEVDARKTKAAMKKLTDFFFGKIDLSATQVTALRDVLDKTSPTLKAIMVIDESPTTRVWPKIELYQIDPGPPEDRAQAWANGMPAEGYTTKLN